VVSPAESTWAKSFAATAAKAGLGGGLTIALQVVAATDRRRKRFEVTASPLLGVG
jgi:hypothetical protein